MKKQQKELNTLKKRHTKVSDTVRPSLERCFFLMRWWTRLLLAGTQRRAEVTLHTGGQTRGSAWQGEVHAGEAAGEGHQEERVSDAWWETSAASSPSFSPDVIALRFSENNCSELKKETAIKVEMLSTDHKEKVREKIPSCFVSYNLLTRLWSIWPYYTQQWHNHML